jgi:NADPH:quinone reductase-like Zn-dependent oxidoreductase
MKAIVVNETSPERELDIQEVPDPVCGPEDVTVCVHAAGVNRADLLQRAGKYPHPPGTSPILGLEVSGEIIEVGSRVTSWRPGMKVCALLSGGGYAEKATVHSGSVLPLPAKASFIEGAAIPEAFITAFTNLFYEFFSFFI